jgi:hypothetical protein
VVVATVDGNVDGQHLAPAVRGAGLGEVTWKQNVGSENAGLHTPAEGMGPAALQIPYHAFLGFVIALGGTNRIGLHACMFEIPLIILRLFISAKSISVSFKNILFCIMTL